MAPAPVLAQWLATAGSRPLARALGIRADDVGDGFAQYVVEPVAAGANGRGAPLSFVLTIAADLAVVDCVSTTVDRAREEMNGTAELNLTYVAQPRGAVTVRGVVLHRGTHLRLVDVELRNGDRGLVAKGRGSYAIRPHRAGAGR